MKCRVSNVNRNSLSSCQGGHWPIKPDAQLHHLGLSGHATAIVGVFTPRQGADKDSSTKSNQVDLRLYSDSAPGVGWERDLTLSHRSSSVGLPDVYALS